MKRYRDIVLLWLWTALFVLVATTMGCSQWFPAEPVVLPPCQMIPRYDAKGNILFYQVDPKHFVGTFMNCDIDKRVYP